MIDVNDYRETPGGTHYRVGTPDEVVATLERARVNRTRLAIVYRDDSVPEFGRVGRSTGPKLRVPLLIHNLRSSGGGEISRTAIDLIMTSDGQQVLYRSGP
jgi:hypothetical protein